MIGKIISLSYIYYPKFFFQYRPFISLSDVPVISPCKIVSAFHSKDGSCRILQTYNETSPIVAI